MSDLKAIEARLAAVTEAEWELSRWSGVTSGARVCSGTVTHPVAVLLVYSRGDLAALVARVKELEAQSPERVWDSERRVRVLSMWLVFALSMAVFFAGVAWILRGAT